MWLAVEHISAAASYFRPTPAKPSQTRPGSLQVRPSAVLPGMTVARLDEGQMQNALVHSDFAFHQMTLLLSIRLRSSRLGYELFVCHRKHSKRCKWDTPAWTSSEPVRRPCWTWQWPVAYTVVEAVIASPVVLGQTFPMGSDGAGNDAGCTGTTVSRLAASWQPDSNSLTAWASSLPAPPFCCFTAVACVLFATRTVL